MVKPTTVRIILTIAATLNWPVHQLDINNAFLNGHLHETVYMRKPQGFEDQNRPNYVCKLHKALYSLKQALRAWFDRLRETLLTWGFHHRKVDPSLFFFVSSKQVFFIPIYVDDIIAANRKEFLSVFTQKFHSSFALKDLGPLHYFLGIQVTRDINGFFLNQSKYALDLLEKFSMSKVNSCPTPMTLNLSLTATEGEKLQNPTMF